MAEKHSKGFDVVKWAQSVLPKNEFDQLVAEIKKPLPVAIRANLLKVDQIQAKKNWMDWYGWKLECIPFCPSGFWLSEINEAPGRTITHRMGYYYIQEAASMLPAQLFDFNNAERPLVLDMASSPGGKTTHIADRTQDKGLIIANDASRSRIPALQTVLRNWGVINQAVSCASGESFERSHPSFFDAVLLDAPCSMQGLRSPDRRHARPVTENELLSLAARQKRLLASALRAVKVGGQVVYATCTLTPHENEEVLDEILDVFENRVAIKDAHQLIDSAGARLHAIGELELSQSMKNALRLWPHNLHTAGFFCAILQKSDELPGTDYHEESHRYKPHRNVSMVKPSLRHAITTSLSNQFGFNLEGIIESQEIVLCEINQRIFLVPDIFLKYMEGIDWVSCGLLLGEFLANQWVPSHEFIARFGDQFKNQVVVLEDHDTDTWLRGEDLRSYSETALKVGSIVAVRDQKGRNLGRGKVLRDRLKNLLPTRIF